MKAASTRTRCYLDQNVYEAALDRIGWVYDQFDHVSVNISGGKDSTVVLNLALQVARQRDRLPLDVMFLDQEAEWKATEDHVAEVGAMPDVRLHWLQVPIRLFNATSPFTPWLDCWAPGAKWMRERRPDSVHDNVYGTRNFLDMFGAWSRHHHPEGGHCLIAGIRTQESPGRYVGLTTGNTYGGETWGRILHPGHYSFYPIYDWRLDDVWKAIYDNEWAYNRIYDDMYRYGVPVNEMRVSNLHHDAAIKSLRLVQELEPDTWDALTERLTGINGMGHLGYDAFRVPKELPWMFDSWVEYRDHLLDNLIVDETARARFLRRFATMERKYDDPAVLELLTRTEVAAILVNDHYGVKLSQFRAVHLNDQIRRRAGERPHAV